MKIEHLSLSQLTPYARNAKLHSADQIEKIAQSIQHYGFNNPVLVDIEGGIIAGHGRVLAARRLGLATVPCIRLGHLSDAQKRAYILADNRLAEIGGGWDLEILKNEVIDLIEVDVNMEDISLSAEDLLGIGIDLTDNDNSPEDSDAEPQIDKAEELREKWKVKSGQLWQLGEHRILCGDSITQSGLAMSEQCQVLIYDPEWNDAPAISKLFECVLAFGDGSCMGQVFQRFGPPDWMFVWDCITSWYVPNRPLRRMKICSFHGPIENYNFNGAHYGDPLESKKVKNSRGEYDFVADPRGKHLSDVFCRAITAEHADNMHNHSKPVDWLRLLIGTCTSGDVFDPFLGSGTTLIACEQLGRKCRAIEISPGYVAVAIQRWADATGKTPMLLS